MGSFYQHFRSKRQLLLALMDELLEKLSALDLRPTTGAGVRAGLRRLLSRASSHDLRHVGTYRAWQEAVLSDPELARQQQRIHAWTTARTASLLRLMQTLPGALPGLAHAMDSFFWFLLAQAVRLRKRELNRQADAAAHLIYHALFTDRPGIAPSAAPTPRPPRSAVPGPPVRLPRRRCL